MKAENLGFHKNELVAQEQLYQWLARAIETQTGIKDKVLNATIDAHIEIFIPADKSEARLNLTKSSGTGKKLDLAEIGKEINKIKLKNLNRDKLKQEILKFYNSPQKELKNYCLARGKPATRGYDGKLDFICSFSSRSETQRHLTETKKNYERIKLKSEHKFPLDSITESVFVQKGAIIAKILPPSQGEPGVDIFGITIPPARGNDPDLRLYENVILSKNEIISDATGILEVGKEQETILLRVRIKEEARWEISFSEHKTSAFLSISPPRGLGSAATLEDIQKTISLKGITRGLKEELLPELVNRAAKGINVDKVVIAEGRSPIDGSGQRLVFHVKIAAGDSLTTNSADQEKKKNTDNLIVDKESIIAEILPPAIGPIEGWCVTGEILKASRGVKIEIQAGANIKIEKTDNNIIKFIAANTGEVIYDGKTLSINPQKVIRGDVGPMTGNISAPGSILIEGSVFAGFKVFSKGNITIQKKIQQAVISADGSIIVNDQIIGKHRTILRSKKNIQIKTATSAIFLAVGDLFIEELCLHSTLKCNGSIKTPPEQGTLAGGVIKARKGLNIHTLGTTEGRETHISFGQDYLIGDQIEIEEKEIEKMNKQIATFDEKMKILEKKKEKDIEKLYQIRKAKRQAFKIIEKRNYRLFMLREKFEEHFPSRIMIYGTIYPGVCIESHGRTYTLTTKKEKIIILFNTETGKFEENPLT